MNTFGTLLLRIERPWLGVPLAGTLLVAACQDAPPERRDAVPVANEAERRDSTEEEPRSTPVADPPPDAADDSSNTAAQHLLVTLSYENGVFTAEKVTRVAGLLREPRSGEVQGKMTYLARAGATSLLLGAAPDPRRVHVEYLEPGSRQMTNVSGTAPGKQYFLVHAPLATDAIDFFDGARVTAPAGSQLLENHAAPPPAARSVIGTVSLEGLL